MRQNFFSLLKWAWILVVSVFILFILKKYFPDLKIAVQQIHVKYLILSFASILAAKILLSLFMYYIVRCIGEDLSLLTCFNIYNLSQPGKYLPGNIWHFVGKAAAYKKAGFSLMKIRDSLILENAWLVLSAFLYGLTMVTIFNFLLIKEMLISHYKYVFIIFFITPILFFFLRKLYKIEFDYIIKNFLKITFLQIFIWSLLGISFAFLSIPFLDDHTNIPIIMGLYAIAYCIGFVTPFAPAGIGVREGILCLGLLPYISIDVIFLLSAVNRVLYILVEIIVALFSQTILSTKKNVRV